VPGRPVRSVGWGERCAAGAEPGRPMCAVRGERGAGRGERGRLNRNEKTGRFGRDRENRMLMLLGPRGRGTKGLDS
jgi:hypothetical protein